MGNKIFSTISAILIIGVGLLFGLKGCFLDLHFFNHLTAYRYLDEKTGSIKKLYLIPRDIILLEEKNGQDEEFGSLQVIEQEVLTHYVGPIYGVNSSSHSSYKSFFGFTIISNAETVMDTKINLLDKFGNNPQAFGTVGEIYPKEKIIIRNSSIEFQDLVFTQVPVVDADRLYVDKANERLKLLKHQ